MPEIDLIKIKEIGLRLVQSVVPWNRRDFVPEVIIGKEPRIKVLVGFRGLGKTTALLQLVDEKSIYFSMDHPYCMGYSLYELGKAFVNAGYTSLLIDEVHHYPEWKRDSKALYDEFSKISLVLSGSAPLAFEPERRYHIIPVNPLSLREFIKIQNKTITDQSEAWRTIDTTLSFLAAHSQLQEYFQHYWQGGGFPIYLSYKEKTLEAVYNGIRKSIREDAPFFAKVGGEDVMLMERFLLTIATSSLGEMSINSLSNNLGMKKQKGYELIWLLEKMKILRLVRPYGRGPKAVRGDSKLLFYHPNIRSAVCATLQVSPDKGALREELAVFSLMGRGWSVYTIKGKKKSPDYMICKGSEKIIVEVGGSSKTRRQLSGFSEQTMLLDERQLLILSLW